MHALAFVLLSVIGQDANTTLPDRVDPQTRIAQLEQENADLRAQLRAMGPTEADYLPSFTWPGYDGPEPFKALANHMRNGEAIHSPTNVDGWSPFKLAFTHDQEHFSEYAREGRPLPNVRDPRLAEWLKTLPKVVKKKVTMRAWRSGCPACERMKPILARLEREGCEVEIVYVRGGPVPTICVGDICHIGFIPYEQLKAMLK